MRLFSYLLILHLFYCQSLVVIGQKKSTPIAERVSPVYTTSEIVLNTRATLTGNPFDLVVGAQIHSPEGNSLLIPGFYNGNGEFIVRFCPDRVGLWTYETYSSEPTLSGKKGAIEVVARNSHTLHGGVTVRKESPRKFFWQDGTPYFPVAFELDWLFALDYSNNEGFPRTQSIVSAIKQNGFNMIVFNVYAHSVNWQRSDNIPAEYNFSGPGYSPFAGTNAKPDFNTLNLTLFKNLDRVIAHLNENGIVAHMMIYVWNKNVNWPAMYSDADNRYFDYIIKRYQGYPNILWDVSKEALDYGRCDIAYINERIERIRRLDGHKRLVTVHDYEYCRQEPEKVDIISVQNWRSDLYSQSLATYNLYLDKPVLNIEHGGYELGPYKSFPGNYTKPENCLLRNYQCAFAGVYSTYYWQNTAWDIVVFDPLHPRHTFQKPRFDYYKHFQELFFRYDYNQLIPVNSKLTINSQIGKDNVSSSGFALTNEKDLYLYFIPQDNYQINIVLPEPANSIMEVTWFNPFTGEFLEKGTTKWSMWAGFQSPWEGLPAVLILKLK